MLRHTLLRALLVMNVVGMPLLSHAAVTFDGTNGVRAQLLTSNSVAACSGCHGVTEVDFVSNYAAFSNYATTYYAGNKQTAVQTMITRTSLPTSDPSFMPNGSLSQINAAEMALLSAWRTNSAVQNDNPTVLTSGSVTASGKDFKLTSDSAKFTLHANVDDSGIADTNYLFQVGLSQVAVSDSVSQGVSGSGGGTGTTAISQQITGLECGTLYHFRVRANNSTYGNVNGNFESETTVACNTAPVIQSTPLSPTGATEDVQFSLDVDALDGEGDGISYSLTNEPSGMAIDGDGIILWTPGEGVSTSGLVTVTAADNGADGVTADTATFTVSVIAVNDAPQITSTAPASAIEDTLYSYQLVVNDPDDSGAGLMYSLSNEPTGMVISASGLITWTPGNGVSTSGSVTARVADNGENGAQPDTEVFVISVSAVNTPPTITSTAPTSASEGVQYSYQVLVTDADDANNGVDLLYQLTNEPTGMTVSATGLIEWTPNQGQGDANNIEIEVRDGGENLAQPDSETFSITVSDVNNPPALNVINDQNVTENQTFTLDLDSFVSDPDDNNNGSDLTWSLLQSPNGFSISNVGVMNWTPGNNSADVYTIQVQVADDGENSAPAAIRSFQLTVTLQDSDSDGFADYSDNCPNNSNSDQANNDSDSEGDVCDNDDDNDGLPDVAEIANGFDPLTANNENLDSDGDGISDLQEYQQCLALNDLQCLQINLDSQAPVITTNGDQLLDSMSYLTPVIIEASAVDAVDGLIIPTVSDAGPFRPGRHSLLWSATDAAGNVANTNQIIEIRPKIILSGQTLVAEGQAISLPIKLSGPAISYPVELTYAISGTVDENDHNLSSGSLNITDGESIDLDFEISNDNLAEENETLLIEITAAGDEVVLEGNPRFEVIITENNIPPEITIELEQMSEQVATIYQDQGNFNIIATAADGNGDSLTWNWLGSNVALNISNTGQINGVQQLTFDPTLLDIGYYALRLAVSDGESNRTVESGFNIFSTAPVLSAVVDSDGDGLDDLLEGLGDADGDRIADYLDPINDSQYMQLGLDDQAAGELIFSDSDITLGQLAHRLGYSGARISSLDLITNNFSSSVFNSSDASMGFLLRGDITNLEISTANNVQGLGHVIIPLQYSIPENARYQVFINNRWQAFSDNDTDAVKSAAKIQTDNQQQESICPDIDSTRYQNGLVPLFDCVLLAITDGGSNDGDGLQNNSISMIGAVAMQADNVQVTPADEQLDIKASASPSKGGAISWLTITLILLVSILGRQAHAGGHDGIHPSLDVTLGYDNNQTRAQRDEDIIADEFFRLDSTFNKEASLSLQQVLSFDLGVSGLKHNNSESLDRLELSGKVAYRFQTELGYRAPIYQISSQISAWQTDSEQRNSTLYQHQVFASARLTTQINWIIGYEHKSRDSEGKVFDSINDRIFVNFDYETRSPLLGYVAYSYQVGDTVSSVQTEYCNGVPSLKVYREIKASTAIEADDAFNQDYCGNWFSYRLDAITHTAMVGANYGISQQFAIDGSWLSAYVKAEDDIEYYRQILQLSLLMRF